MVVLFALVALAFAEETKTEEKKVETTKKDKRGLYGALGYGYGLDGLSYGYGLNGLNTYSSLPLGINHGISTVLTKEVAVPVPQPVAVPVEKQVPVPVKVSMSTIFHSLFSHQSTNTRDHMLTCENSSAIFGEKQTALFHLFASISHLATGEKKKGKRRPSISESQLTGKRT